MAKRRDNGVAEVEYVSPEECGRRIGLDGRTVRRFIEQGLIPHIRVPRRIGETIANSFKVPITWISEVQQNKIDFRQNLNEAQEGT